MKPRTLEARSFVAVTQDIRKLVDEYMDASRVAGGARGTYLKTLVATTRADLGMKPRKTTQEQSGRLTAEQITVHEAALEAVHKRFYVIILEGLRELMKGQPQKAINQKSNFARSYKSSLRRFIRAGNDIGCLAASEVTRELLTVNRSKKPAPVRLLKRVDSFAVYVTGKAADRETKLQVSQKLIDLAAQLTNEAGNTGSRDIERARKNNQPFITDDGVFLPVTRKMESAAAHT